MSGLDTSQVITDEVSLHAAEHHHHSRPHAAGTPAPAPEEAPESTASTGPTGSTDEPEDK